MDPLLRRRGGSSPLESSAAVALDTLDGFIRYGFDVLLKPVSLPYQGARAVHASLQPTIAAPCHPLRMPGYFYVNDRVLAYRLEYTSLQPGIVILVRHQQGTYDVRYDSDDGVNTYVPSSGMQHMADGEFEGQTRYHKAPSSSAPAAAMASPFASTSAPLNAPAASRATHTEPAPPSPQSANHFGESVAKSDDGYSSSSEKAPGWPPSTSWPPPRGDEGRPAVSEAPTADGEILVEALIAGLGQLSVSPAHFAAIEATIRPTLESLNSSLTDLEAASIIKEILLLAVWNIIGGTGQASAEWKQLACNTFVFFDNDMLAAFAKKGKKIVIVARRAKAGEPSLASGEGSGTTAQACAALSHAIASVPQGSNGPATILYFEQGLYSSRSYIHIGHNGEITEIVLAAEARAAMAILGLLFAAMDARGGIDISFLSHMLGHGYGLPLHFPLFDSSARNLLSGTHFRWQGRGVGGVQHFSGSGLGLGTRKGEPLPRTIVNAVRAMMKSAAPSSDAIRTEPPRQPVINWPSKLPSPSLPSQSWRSSLLLPSLQRCRATPIALEWSKRRSRS